jgi:bacillithiol system protein YtxJ
MSWNTLFGGEKKQATLPWIELNSEAQLEKVLADSITKPQLIFKHSTRCSISSMALSRLEKEWNLDGQVDAWYLDLLDYRGISNAIATKFGVIHESPQAILIRHGKVTHVSSHSGISVRAIAEAIGS